MPIKTARHLQHHHHHHHHHQGSSPSTPHLCQKPARQRKISQHGVRPRPAACAANPFTRPLAKVNEVISMHEQPASHAAAAQSRPQANMPVAGTVLSCTGSTDGAPACCERTGAAVAATAATLGYCAEFTLRPNERKAPPSCAAAQRKNTAGRRASALRAKLRGPAGQQSTLTRRRTPTAVATAVAATVAWAAAAAQQKSGTCSSPRAPSKIQSRTVHADSWGFGGRVVRRDEGLEWRSRARLTQVSTYDTNPAAGKVRFAVGTLTATRRLPKTTQGKASRQGLEKKQKQPCKSPQSPCSSLYPPDVNFRERKNIRNHHTCTNLGPHRPRREGDPRRRRDQEGPPRRSGNQPGTQSTRCR
jgi:hypothetical protein